MKATIARLRRNLDALAPQCARPHYAVTRTVVSGQSEGGEVPDGPAYCDGCGVELDLVVCSIEIVSNEGG